MLSCLLLLAQLRLQLIQLGLETLRFLLALTTLGLESLRRAMRETWLAALPRALTWLKHMGPLGVLDSRTFSLRVLRTPLSPNILTRPQSRDSTQPPWLSAELS